MPIVDKKCYSEILKTTCKNIKKKLYEDIWPDSYFFERRRMVMNPKLFKQVWIGTESDFYDSVAHENKSNWKYVPCDGKSEMCENCKQLQSMLADALETNKLLIKKLQNSPWDPRGKDDDGTIAS